MRSRAAMRASRSPTLARSGSAIAITRWTMSTTGATWAWIA
jgi:hypothetical protein